MVATTFGLARYGYGLLLPDIRRSFGLSSTTLGLIATGSYLAYLLGTAVLAGFGDRAGPRRPVLIGGVSAGESWRSAWGVFAVIALLCPRSALHARGSGRSSARFSQGRSPMEWGPRRRSSSAGL